MTEKIRNYGMVNYNRYKKQIEYTYFEKNEEGIWGKKSGQKTVVNEIFVPHGDSVVQQITGGTPSQKKDLFGNPILAGISCDFFDKKLPSSIRTCPRRFSYDINPVIKFLADEFEFDEEKDEIPPLRTQYMDIETIVDDKGFLQAWDVGPDRLGTSRGGITLISSYDNIDDHTTVFGVNPYNDTTHKLTDNVTYVWCKDERGIIREYLKYLKKTDPEIMVAWNGFDYDIPYILNRMILLFGEKSLKHFGNGTAWIKNEARRLIVNGINIVDYMVLYKKFELTPRRSYALAAIVEEENIEIGGEGKIKYEGSIKDFYERDWNGFVRYCIQDSKLVYELDNKKKLIDTFVMCCYMAGISFNLAIGSDVSWLKIHDAAIYRYCQKKDIQLPEMKEVDRTAGKIKGAFVMAPIPKLYEYITVYDVASLYPSCIRALNISPDTYRGRVLSGSVTEQNGPFVVEFFDSIYLSLGEYSETIVENHNRYSEEKIDPNITKPTKMTFITFADLQSYLKEKNYCIAMNGVIFTKEFRGIIPSLLDKWFSIRVKNKKKYFDYKKKSQLEQDPSKKHEYKIESGRYYTIQQVQKILMNSLFGFISCAFSRLYSKDLGEAITSTGQYLIKTTSEEIQNKSQKLFTKKISGGV